MSKRASICCVLLALAAVTPPTLTASRPVLAQERPTVPAPQGPALAWNRLDRIGPEFLVAATQVLDVDGDGDDEVLLIGRDGEVRVWHFRSRAKSFAEEPVGALRLPHPARSLIAVGDILGTGGPGQLVVLSPDGLVAYPATERGAYAAEGVALCPAAKFPLRVGLPRFIDFLTDVDNDGRLDVVVPMGAECHLFVQRAAGTNGVSGGAGAAQGTFQLAARVPVDLDRDRATETLRLSDVLESTFRIPRVTFQDVNGDGRKDLLVEDGNRRAFHLQAADGSLPRLPTVSVDLGVFVDTTPQGDIRLGRTLAGEEKQRIQTVDLDRDGIPDYVIAHRRKVWVFHGGSAGPQFTEPSVVLKVAEDVTALLVADLDENQLPDLLLLRVEVPTVATLLRGLVASWDIEIRALGYANIDGRSFETKARWNSELAMRLPSILGILRDADKLVQQFEGAAGAFRSGVFDDFDGDGNIDLALPTTEKTRIETWRTSTSEVAESTGGVDFRSLLFDDANKVWDLDRILRFLGSAADQRVQRLTGGRPADGGIDTSGDADREYVGVVGGHFDESGRADLLLEYRLLDGTVRSVYELYRLGD